MESYQDKMYYEKLQEQKGGFNFDDSLRNIDLQKKHNLELQFTSTGTTILGFHFADGIILAADTRATAGTIVADKNCKKIEQVADNIYICGAGTAADCSHMKFLMRTQLELMRLNQNRQSRVSTILSRSVNHLHRYQGHIGAYLIVGGYDCTGPQLACVSANGYATYQEFTSMGSGSLAAMAILQAKYKENMNLEEAKALAVEGIEAGIFHDEGSGSNVDICVITKDKATYLRNYISHDKKASLRAQPYQFPLGNTPYYSQLDIKLANIQLDRQPLQDHNQMEII